MRKSDRSPHRRSLDDAFTHRSFSGLTNFVPVDTSTHAHDAVQGVWLKPLMCGVEKEEKQAISMSHGSFGLLCRLGLLTHNTAV